MVVRNESKAAQLMRERVDKRFEHEMLKAKFIDEGIEVPSWVRPGDLSTQQLAAMTNSFPASFMRGLKSTVAAGAFASDEDFVEPEDNVGAEFAYMAGHFVGFLADLAILKGAGKAFSALNAGSKSAKLVSWNKTVGDWWSKASRSRREKWLKHGWFKAGQTTVDDVNRWTKGWGAIEKEIWPLSKGRGGPRLSTLNNEVKEFLLDEKNWTRQGKSIRNGVRFDLNDISPDSIGYILPGPLLNKLAFGVQMGARESFAQSVMAKKFGITDAYGNIIKNADEVSWADAWQAGAMGMETFVPDKAVNLLKMPFIQGFGSGVMISAGHHATNLVVANTLKNTPMSGRIAEVLGGVAFFSMLESMPYVMEDPEKAKRKAALGAALGALFSGLSPLDVFKKETYLKNINSKGFETALKNNMDRDARGQPQEKLDLKEQASSAWFFANQGLGPQVGKANLFFKDGPQESIPMRVTRKIREGKRLPPERQMLYPEGKPKAETRKPPSVTEIRELEKREPEYYETMAQSSGLGREKAREEQMKEGYIEWVKHLESRPDREKTAKILGFDKEWQGVLQDLKTYKEKDLLPGETMESVASEIFKGLVRENTRMEGNVPKFSELSWATQLKVDDTISKGKVSVIEQYDYKDLKWLDHTNPESRAYMTPEEKPRYYVFGDNLKREGTGGQATIRPLGNALGIATKKAPSMKAGSFFKDSEYKKNKEIIDADIKKITDKRDEGYDIVFPDAGIGTGRAKLKTEAPRTWEYLNRRLREEFKIENSKELEIWSTVENGFEPLSNLWPTKIVYKSRPGPKGEAIPLEFKSAEHAYQTWKDGKFNAVAYKDKVWDKPFPRNVKKFRADSQQALRKNSERIMEEILTAKFRQNPELNELLMETKGKDLTHRNAKDKFWRNKFPELLMKRREKSLKQEREVQQERQEELTKLEAHITSRQTVAKKFFEGHEWKGRTVQDTIEGMKHMLQQRDPAELEAMLMDKSAWVMTEKDFSKEVLEISDMPKRFRFDLREDIKDMLNPPKNENVIKDEPLTAEQLFSQVEKYKEAGNNKDFSRALIELYNKGNQMYSKQIQKYMRENQDKLAEGIKDTVMDMGKDIDEFTRKKPFDIYDALEGRLKKEKAMKEKTDAELKSGEVIRSAVLDKMYDHMDAFLNKELPKNQKTFESIPEFWRISLMAEKFLTKDFIAKSSIHTGYRTPIEHVEGTSHLFNKFAKTKVGEERIAVEREIIIKSFKNDYLPEAAENIIKDVTTRNRFKALEQTFRIQWDKLMNSSPDTLTPEGLNLFNAMRRMYGEISQNPKTGGRTWHLTTNAKRQMVADFNMYTMFKLLGDHNSAAHALRKKGGKEFEALAEKMINETVTHLSEYLKSLYHKAGFESKVFEQTNKDVYLRQISEHLTKDPRYPEKAKIFEKMLESIAKDLPQEKVLKDITHELKAFGFEEIEIVNGFREKGTMKQLALFEKGEPVEVRKQTFLRTEAESEFESGKVQILKDKHGDMRQVGSYEIIPEAEPLTAFEKETMKYLSGGAKQLSFETKDFNQLTKNDILNIKRSKHDNLEVGDLIDIRPIDDIQKVEVYDKMGLFEREISFKELEKMSKDPDAFMEKVIEVSGLDYVSQGKMRSVMFGEEKGKTPDPKATKILKKKEKDRTPEEVAYVGGMKKITDIIGKKVGEYFEEGTKLEGAFTFGKGRDVLTEINRTMNQWFSKSHVHHEQLETTREDALSKTIKISDILNAFVSEGLIDGKQVVAMARAEGGKWSPNPRFDIRKSYNFPFKVGDKWINLKSLLNPTWGVGKQQFKNNTSVKDAVSAINKQIKDAHKQGKDFEWVMEGVYKDGVKKKIIIKKGTKQKEWKESIYDMILTAFGRISTKVAGAGGEKRGYVPPFNFGFWNKALKRWETSPGTEGRHFQIGIHERFVEGKRGERKVLVDYMEASRIEETVKAHKNYIKEVKEILKEEAKEGYENPNLFDSIRVISGIQEGGDTNILLSALNAGKKYSELGGTVPFKFGARRKGIDIEKHPTIMDFKKKGMKIKEGEEGKNKKDWEKGKFTWRDYFNRTQANIIESDITINQYVPHKKGQGDLAATTKAGYWSGGMKLTRKLAANHKKPIIDIFEPGRKNKKKREQGQDERFLSVEETAEMIHDTIMENPKLRRKLALGQKIVINGAGNGRMPPEMNKYYQNYMKAVFEKLKETTFKKSAVHQKRISEFFNKLMMNPHKTGVLDPKQIPLKMSIGKKMPTKDNTFGEDMTAIDLINLGKKTSTTRRLAGEVGDFITFKEDTKKATYQITDIIEIKDVWENKYGKTEVGKEGKSIPLDLWSKEEGWSKDYLKKKFETVWKADIEAGKPIAIHRFKKLERTDKRKKKQEGPEIKKRASVKGKQLDEQHISDFAQYDWRNLLMNTFETKTLKNRNQINMGKVVASDGRNLTVRHIGQVDKMDLHRAKIHVKDSQKFADTEHIEFNIHIGKKKKKDITPGDFTNSIIDFWDVNPGRTSQEIFSNVLSRMEADGIKIKMAGGKTLPKELFDAFIYDTGGIAEFKKQYDKGEISKKQFAERIDMTFGDNKDLFSLYKTYNPKYFLGEGVEATRLNRVLREKATPEDIGDAVDSYVLRNLVNLAKNHNKKAKFLDEYMLYEKKTELPGDITEAALKMGENPKDLLKQFWKTINLNSTRIKSQIGQSGINRLKALQEFSSFIKKKKDFVMDDIYRMKQDPMDLPQSIIESYLITTTGEAGKLQTQFPEQVAPALKETLSWVKKFMEQKTPKDIPNWVGPYMKEKFPKITIESNHLNTSSGNRHHTLDVYMRDKDSSIMSTSPDYRVTVSPSQAKMGQRMLQSHDFVVENQLKKTWAEKDKNIDNTLDVDSYEMFNKLVQKAGKAKVEGKGGVYMDALAEMKGMIKESVGGGADYANLDIAKVGKKYVPIIHYKRGDTYSCYVCDSVRAFFNRTKKYMKESMKLVFDVGADSVREMKGTLIQKASNVQQLFMPLWQTWAESYHKETPRFIHRKIGQEMTEGMMRDFEKAVVTGEYINADGKKVKMSENVPEELKTFELDYIKQKYQKYYGPGGLYELKTKEGELVPGRNYSLEKFQELATQEARKFVDFSDLFKEQAEAQIRHLVTSGLITERHAANLFNTAQTEGKLWYELNDFHITNMFIPQEGVDPNSPEFKDQLATARSLSISHYEIPLLNRWVKRIDRILENKLDENGNNVNDWKPVRYHTVNTEMWKGDGSVPRQVGDADTLLRESHYWQKDMARKKKGEFWNGIKLKEDEPIKTWHKRLRKRRGKMATLALKHIKKLRKWEEDPSLLEVDEGFESIMTTKLPTGLFRDKFFTARNIKASMGVREDQLRTWNEKSGNALKDITVISDPIANTHIHFMGLAKTADKYKTFALVDKMELDPNDPNFDAWSAKIFRRTMLDAELNNPKVWEKRKDLIPQIASNNPDDYYHHLHGGDTQYRETGKIGRDKQVGRRLAAPQVAASSLLTEATYGGNRLMFKVLRFLEQHEKTNAFARKWLKNLHKQVRKKDGTTFYKVGDNPLVPDRWLTKRQPKPKKGEKRKNLWQLLREEGFETVEQYQMNFINQLMLNLKKTGKYKLVEELGLDSIPINKEAQNWQRRMAIVNPSEGLYRRLHHKYEWEKGKLYSWLAENNYRIKRLIMWNPMFHGWNLAVNAATVLNMPGTPQRKTEPKMEEFKKMVEDKYRENGLLTEFTKQQIDNMSAKHFEGWAELKDGFVKGVGKLRGKSPAFAQPIDLSKPEFQFMIQSGFPLGEHPDLHLPKFNLTEINPTTGRRWMDDINETAGFNLFTNGGRRWLDFGQDFLFKTLGPVLEKQTFYRIYNHELKELRKRNTKNQIGWNEKEISQMAGDIAARYTTNFSGKLHKLDMPRVYDAAGRIGFFAHNWTGSNIRIATGMLGLGNNLQGGNSINRRLTSNFREGVAKYLTMQILASQILNMVNTEGKYTWENEPGRQHSVAVGRNYTEGGYFFTDLNRFLNDLWNWSRPSFLKGSVVGYLLANGLPIGGLGSIAARLGGTLAGGSIGAAMSGSKTFKTIEKYLGMPTSDNTMTPEIDTIKRKMNPIFRVLGSILNNTNNWGSGRIFKTDAPWSEQAQAMALHAVTELTPFDSGEWVKHPSSFLWGVKDYLGFNKGEETKKWGLLSGFWISESRKVTSFYARQAALEGEMKARYKRIMTSNLSDKQKKAMVAVLRKRYKETSAIIRHEMKEYIKAYEDNARWSNPNQPKVRIKRV